MYDEFEDDLSQDIWAEYALWWAMFEDAPDEDDMYPDAYDQAMYKFEHASDDLE